MENFQGWTKQLHEGKIMASPHGELGEQPRGAGDYPCVDGL